MEIIFLHFFHFITIKRFVSTDDLEEGEHLQYSAHLHKGSGHSKARVMDRTTPERLLGYL